MSSLQVDNSIFEGHRNIPQGRLALQMSTAGVVHDLGNLIQVASSALNHLGRDPNIATAPGAGMVIAGAKTALEKAGCLVRQTIRTAREIEEVVSHANVGICLADVEALVRSAWDENLRVEVCIDPDLPLVRCDRAGLQNAVLNLLLNARDAMPDGGLISVHAMVSGNPREVNVRVEDRGIGMTSETMVRAFDLFFTTKGEGLGGVGLPMVKRFVEDSGGSIDLASILGSGTVVTLKLPAMR
ncbi:ATP-binding protein [Mesorhizobium sp. M0924]|uniref:sensor histidine kinase n=1 Tax=unclassified Mesorhizobium TaxID=325217 RepID=UPI0003CF5F2D|nr:MULTISPECIES: ATP-binding protein [unclassified Mesorhizobium]ESY07262.1 histidine kinase [Mesorhizobium sp. LNJC399B00]ESY23308.1 histidine kinase [Mesorhizobium sp. LNJC394B00]ESZ43536.1 histidine kinase [Mesorhizobium sp. L103C565B0]WJI70554.1 ATP-binding protein [Mesorhizobium sp. C399B]